MKAEYKFILGVVMMIVGIVLLLSELVVFKVWVFIVLKTFALALVYTGFSLLKPFIKT